MNVFVYVRMILLNLYSDQRETEVLLEERIFQVNLAGLVIRL